MFEPESASQLAAIVRDLPSSQTLTCSPLPTNQNQHLVSLSKMSSVVDHADRDFTVTVQAGMTVSRLKEHLRKSGQRIPVDHLNDQQTLGAWIAGNTFGGQRFGHGTLRDYVIGIEAVDGAGRVYHSGGRVVKNVAGYDFCRLLTGSAGAFGIITEVTLKLKPLASQTTWIRFNVPMKQLSDTHSNIMDCRATPVMINAVPLNDSVAIDLVVEGTKEVCEWQQQQLSEAIQQPPVETATIPDADQQHLPGWQRLAKLTKFTQVFVQRSEFCAAFERLNPIMGYMGDAILVTSQNHPPPSIAGTNIKIIGPDHDPAAAPNQLVTRLLRTFDPHHRFRSPRNSVVE